VFRRAVSRSVSHPAWTSLLAFRSPARTSSSSSVSVRRSAYDRVAVPGNLLPWGSPPLRRSQLEEFTSRRPVPPWALTPFVPGRLVAGFHTRFVPPSPFFATLTVCTSSSPVTCFSHSHPGGSLPLLPSSRRPACLSEDRPGFVVAGPARSRKSAPARRGGWVPRREAPGRLRPVALPSSFFPGSCPSRRSFHPPPGPPKRSVRRASGPPSRTFCQASTGFTRRSGATAPSTEVNVAVPAPRSCRRPAFGLQPACADCRIGARSAPGCPDSTTAPVARDDSTCRPLYGGASLARCRSRVAVSRFPFPVPPGTGPGSVSHRSESPRRTTPIKKWFASRRPRPPPKRLAVPRSAAPARAGSSDRTRLHVPTGLPLGSPGRSCLPALASASPALSPWSSRRTPEGSTVGLRPPAGHEDSLFVCQ
jgi:hypothetical protein